MFTFSQNPVFIFIVTYMPYSGVAVISFGPSYRFRNSSQTKKDTYPEWVGRAENAFL